MEDTRLIEQLKAKVYASVEGLEARDVGIAFSGGVDSSLLAKVCKDASKNVTLLTVGFSSRWDVDVSEEISKTLGLSMFYDLIPPEELENGLRTVLTLIEFDRIVRLENCVSFYYVFRLASNHGLGTVLSANGLDELFCGYSAYRNLFGDERGTSDLMKALVETAKKDKEETDKLSALFGVKYICPFLSQDFVDFAMTMPSGLKIRSETDEVRKHILREAAMEVGVPRSAAMRAKKAFQYSSGIHKAITGLARMRGFTRKDARAEGFRSEVDAYVKSLKYR